MVLIFCVFAYVQHNDDDGLWWALVYVAPILFTAWAQFRPVGVVALIFLLASFTGAVFVEPDLQVWISPEQPGKLYPIETGREALGLVLVGLWSLFIYLRERKQVSDRKVLAVT